MQERKARAEAEERKVGMEMETLEEAKRKAEERRVQQPAEEQPRATAVEMEVLRYGTTPEQVEERQQEEDGTTPEEKEK